MKPGYKQTEVGVIPDDWDLKTLESLTSLLTNGFVGTATSAYVEGDDGVLYIQGYNVQENGFNFHGIKRVSRAFHARHQKSSLKPGDLLTIQTGDIGVTAIVPPQLAGANCHALVISRLRRGVSEPGFYCQYFNSERGRRKFKEIETGSTMKHLNVGDMKVMLLPSPPFKEQQVIAEALSDTDALLGGLDGLIAKRRNLKQAAIQQLLTVQTRLPGFQGEWAAKRIGKLAQLYQPETIGQSLFTEDGFPVYGANGIIGRYSRYNHSTPQITISCRGNCGTVNRTEQFSWITGNAMVVNLDKNKSVDPDFMFHLLKSQDFSILVTGSGQPQIVRGPLAEFQIRLPADRAEQTAIAEVLTEMDMELAALEQRREKTRDLKQAMMQGLLTGKTRLI